MTQLKQSTRNDIVLKQHCRCICKRNDNNTAPNHTWYSHSTNDVVTKRGGAVARQGAVRILDVQTKRQLIGNPSNKRNNKI